MAKCKDCIHEKVCLHRVNIQTETYAYMGFRYDIEKCEHFIADVVPKSEVERLEKILDSYALQYGTVMDKHIVIEKARAEVASEIFEDIEREIEEALKSNYEARRVYNPTDEFGMWVQGKIDALRGIEGFLAELKKKYTEDKTDG